jgi:hypothetical protein
MQDETLPGDLQGPLGQVCAAIECSVKSGLLRADLTTHTSGNIGVISGAAELCTVR